MNGCNYFEHQEQKNSDYCYLYMQQISHKKHSHAID